MNKLLVTFCHGIAGSGKTHSLKKRIASLTQIYAPDEIMAVSFTKTAANNLAKEYGVQARTMHSLGYEIGGFSGKNILSDKEIDFLMGGFATNIKYQRNQNFSPGQSYLNILAALKGHTFEDLLDFMPTHFNFKVLLIDEAQDMTPLMHAFVAKLADSGKLEKLIYSGDKMQGIFQFMASEPDFQTMALSFLKKIHVPFNWTSENLTVSYRLPKIVADFLNETFYCKLKIQHKKSFPQIKVPETAAEGFLRVFPGSDMLCPEFVSLHRKGTAAILCRTNYQVKKLVSLFQKSGYCVRTNGENNLTIDSPKVKAGFEIMDNIWGYGKKINMDLVRSFLRKKHFEPRKLLSLHDLELTEGEKSLILNLYANRNNEIIDIYTIHAAKGLEWDTVFYLNDDGNHVFTSSKEEAYQLFYVATTRTKNRLYIFHVNSLVEIETI